MALLTIPGDFWPRPPVRDALRRRDIGALFHLFKRYAGASQTRIGTAVGLEQGYVSKVMTGRRTITAIDVLERIADGCAMPDESRMLLGLAPRLSSWKPAGAHISDSANGDDGVLRRNLLMLPLAGIALDIPDGAIGRRIGSRVPTQLRQRAARLRRLDGVLGGGDTYRAYLSEYRATATLLKNGRYTEQTGRELLSVLAEQAQQAGWAAFDAGWHAQATGLYKASLRAATDAEDQPLAGNALAFRAYQMLDPDPHGAVELAKSSCRVAGEDAHGRVQALLHERLARANAAVGNATAAQSALATAEASLRDVTGSQPDWASWVDRNELLIMAGRCWTALRRPLRAAPLLERALADFADAHARDKALYLSYLAQAYLSAGEVEQAAEIASRVWRLSEGVASVRPRATDGSPQGVSPNTGCCLPLRTSSIEREPESVGDFPAR
ncbi:MAG: helix-turn-helix domain-containing protein [Micromonosporaceae bacterium]